MNSVHENNSFNICTETEFSEFALQVFQRQAEEVTIYKNYLNLIKVNPKRITNVKDIPFLPISFFKSHKVAPENKEEEIIFSSSGTTGQVSSKHFVTDLSVYEDAFQKGFKQFYGNPEDYCILALLPAYLERTGSSLVYMVDKLIKHSKHSKSGFYLNNHQELRETLNGLKAEKQKTLLIGVSFGLLDFIEEQSFHWSELTVMETGGMKGRRKEMIRSELHSILKNGFGVNQIHSEYGMTELLSQAYSKGNGLYQCPPWMKVSTRDSADPFSTNNYGQSGGLNIIDLANINSCAFIATDDLAKVYEDGSFEVLGRFDSAEVRGCNLMI
jgi:phenylacetate-coenzyme A ligase PaaK-like adenylate-forming protein